MAKLRYIPLENAESEHCALIIEKGLAKVSGVESQKVEINNHRAAITVTNNETDKLYESAIEAGAWGGKILGAGGGGCLLFIAEPSIQQKIQEALEDKAKELKLEGFKRVQFGLTQSGVDILFNSSNTQ